MAGGGSAIALVVWALALSYQPTAPSHAAASRVRRGACATRTAPTCHAEERWASRPLIAISAEYAQLCQAQFEILSATVGAARCAVYFRREHPLSGALEFVPVAVYPQAQSVWVVGQNGDLPTAGLPELPGYTAAPTLIPDYPFVRKAASEHDGGGCGLLLPDGGLTFPLQVSGVIVGVLTIWTHHTDRAAPPAAATRKGADADAGAGAGAGAGAPQRARRLSAAQCECAMAVARSLALSTMLDQRLLWSGVAHERGTEDALLAQVGVSLRASVHQLGSPLSALRLFSKLILRRLASDDSATRQLVREVVTQAARAQDLIGPLQALASQLPPPQARELSSAGDGGGGGVGGLAQYGTRAALPALLGHRALLWVPDAVRPLAHSFAQLADETGVRFEMRLAGETPPVLASQREVREGVSNLLDNALRYGTGLVALSVDAVDAAGGDGDGDDDDDGDYADDVGEDDRGENAWADDGGSWGWEADDDDDDEDDEDDEGLERAMTQRERQTDGANERPVAQPTRARARTSADDGAVAPSGCVRVRVWNSGPGIPEHELARAFEPGFRGVRSQQPRARGGSGLGLSIVRELFHAVGGNVTLRNAPAPRWLASKAPHVPVELLGSGTVAEVVLPRAPLLPP